MSDPNNAAYERQLKVERLRVRYWKATNSWTSVSWQIRDLRTEEDDWARRGKYEDWRDRLYNLESVCASHRKEASDAGSALVEMDEQP